MPDASRVVVMMVWECACCSALAVVTQGRPRLLVNAEVDRRVAGGVGACVLFRCGSCGGVHVVYLNRALGCPEGSGSSTREALSSRELWPWRWRIDSRCAKALALHERNLGTYGRRDGEVSAGQRRRHGRRPVVRLVVLDCPLSVTAQVFGELRAVNVCYGSEGAVTRQWLMQWCTGDHAANVTLVVEVSDDRADVSLMEVG